MAVEKGDVEHVATLARLAFTEEELVAFTTEMNGILALFEELEGVDTDGVEPAFRVLRRRNVFRGDEPGEMLPSDEALANAPDRHEDAFRVPAVLPND
ncbi:MAG: Asp-tRNA(Asn)/Glu-tRNA(Gln) amidotransferase subunit GatC [Candidatus Eisenbacteria sp.]|nr:Asp-tRNA(Asn)/Glu-tRNA(Gln) amidotransferase subunit GatC [Candidatus Eisenbacteria bacterium]